MAEFSANFHEKNFAAAARLDKEEYYNTSRARREAEKKEQIHEGQEAGKNHAKVRALEALESEKTRKYLDVERNFARLEVAGQAFAKHSNVTRAKIKDQVVGKRRSTTLRSAATYSRMV